MKQNLLLIEDVDHLGRSGDIVSVKSGYARNFLIPKGKGVIANKHALHMQERLVQERAKKAAMDKKEAEELSEKLKGITLVQEVKVDPEGKMYGSVSAADIIQLLEQEQVFIEKNWVQLKHPIKQLGVIEIPLRLKEGVVATVILKVLAENEGGQQKEE